MEQPPNSPWRFSSLGKSWNNWRFSSHVWWHQRVVSQWKFVHWKFMRHIFLGKTFSRMRSKGSRFTLGVWGLRVCSLDVAQPFATARNSQQPFATARNRLQPSATARKRSHEVASAHGKFCSRGHFWRFHVSRSDISFFYVVGAIFLRRFQKMSSSLRGRCSTLDPETSIVILRGRRSTLEELRCVFFANHIARAASSGDKVQVPWQAWRFVRCAENWWKPRTKHRFWGSKF